MSVGLDIGTKSVKLVELSQENKSWNLKASGIASYSGMSIEGTEDDKQLSSLVDVIKKLHKEARISSKEVAVSLPEPHVFTRTIKFPLLTDSEVSSAVKWEAEQYIPIPIEEAIVQHKIIERAENETPAQVIVLLVAAPKTLVEKFSRVVEMAGLRLAAVETELMSLVRSLAPRDQTVFLVDFGARSTDIAVSKNGNLMFARSIATAGEAFTRSIAKSLGISEKQAEEYKKSYGLSEQHLEGKIQKALDPVFRMVADEMKKALYYYKSEAKGTSPTSAILSGGTAGMPYAASMLAKLLGIEVLVGNPFSEINVDPEVVKSLVGYAPLYSVAVGLALRGE